MKIQTVGDESAMTVEVEALGLLDMVRHEVGQAARLTRKSANSVQMNGTPDMDALMDAADAMRRAQHHGQRAIDSLGDVD